MNYPLFAPDFSITSCTDHELLFNKLQQVCPDVVCWRPEQLSKGDIRLCGLVFQNWSPALTVPRCLRLLKNKLEGLSFVEAYDCCILESIPIVATPRTGVANIMFGTNNEPSPPSYGKGPQFVLLMDPMYISLDNGRGEHSMSCWHRDETTYFELAAPFCFKHAESWQTMKDLIGQLKQKGYSTIEAYQSGLTLKMPCSVPIYHCSVSSSITTPGSYGG